ncbi:MAG: D-alanyl-D-alanine carboxypeptidase [Eubacterium sp.]|nr:D-alanyl-D-alanine carboxypeptidase [Eubacterium sp.]
MAEIKAVQKTDMPEIKATAAIVVTQNEGKILLEKNAKKMMYPAFITKILASIIALEKCSPSDTVVVSQGVVAEMSKWKNSASIGLIEGERISVLDLVYSMMLASANDSMFALGEFICGGKDKFAQMMQEKAKALGAESTVLTDNEGRFTSEQLSNAYDLAIICRYCMTNRIFRTIANTEKYTIAATDKSPERVISNSNLLVNSSYKRYKYDTAIGIKSGYTAKSKACLACSALPPKGKHGEEIMAIVLGAEHTKQMKYVFYDAITLLDFTFDNFEQLSGKKSAAEEIKAEDALFTVSELCDVLKVTRRNSPDAAINSIAVGRQKIKKDCAYFAADDRAAKEAYNNGAAVVITEKPVSGIANIVVTDINAAKERLASHIKTKLGMWSIAVLDSPEQINPLNMICGLLNEKMKTVKSASLENNYDAMLKALLSASKDTGAAVINVSAETRENAERVSTTAGTDIAIIAAAAASKNPNELSKQEMLDRKLGICKGMSEAGAVIMNIDDKRVAGIFSIQQDIITVGVDNHMADYYADSIVIEEDKISFDIVNGDNIHHIELYSDNKHAIYQALITFALGEIMGIPAKQTAVYLEKYRKSPGMSTVKNGNNVTVISDFENTGSDSVAAALKELCNVFIQPEARRIAVFADIAGGGESEESLFRRVGTAINKSTVDITVCYGDTAANIAQTADLKNKSVIILKSEAALTEFLGLNIRPNDAVLFKGSEDSGLADIMTAIT